MSDSDRRDLSDIVDVAARLGVELDRQEALRWIVAMSAAGREHHVAEDADTGIFGHRVSLVDFDPAELAYFRDLARRVRVASRPNVESAIAIAGSAAQSKVQIFPGDYDFFERINIKSDTMDAAQATLREILRETALRAFAERDIVLVEANFGVYPCAVTERATPRRAGDSITWTPPDVVNGRIDVLDGEGRPLTIRWDDIGAGPGWTYIGWIVADRDGGRIALASNMMEVTWESPSGDLTALDGSIDPCFQEVYLEREAISVFRKIVRHVDAGAMSAYVNAMRDQAFHYTYEAPDFCKASKRLYNLLRLTGELEAAAYVRELFDEPGARMYQVRGLLEAADVALDAAAAIDRDTVVRQIDRVIQTVVEAIDGPAEAALAGDLRRLRAVVTGDVPHGAVWREVLQDIRTRSSHMVSDYFRDRLLGLPRIVELIEHLRA